MSRPGLSVLIPAHDEAACIDACLSALLTSDPTPGSVQVIVIANGCTDDTADRARAHAGRAGARGWRFEVVETPEGDKLNAWNLGERAAQFTTRVYLDADVAVDPPLLAALARALETDAPIYASGRPRVARPVSWVTRAYARFWTGLPFFKSRAPGFGLFAVNTAGRARWDAFPRIISDDTFVRLHFAPSERVEVAAGYSWPMVEGLRNLIRVRRRQDIGVREIADAYPALLQNDDTARPSLTRLIGLTLRAPLGCLVYGVVSLAVRTPLFGGDGWVRGR